MAKEKRNKKPAPLPPDPDNMNHERACWAGECISLMSEMTGCEPGQEALGDLFCNIFHWGDRNGFTPEEIENIFAARRALYREETTADPFAEED